MSFSKSSNLTRPAGSLNFDTFFKNSLVQVNSIALEVVRLPLLIL